MSSRIILTLCMALVPLYVACIPGIDTGGVAEESADGSVAGLDEQSSDWFRRNKVSQLFYEPLPSRAEDGSIPRSIGKYSLLGEAPLEGKEYRDKQKIFYVEEISKNRRIRVFSRDSVIFRIQALTRLTELTDNVDSLEQQIIGQYGTPDHKIKAELSYVDEATVLLFSMSAEFLITDLMDVSTTELPRHLLAIVESAR